MKDTKEKRHEETKDIQSPLLRPSFDPVNLPLQQWRYISVAAQIRV